MTHDPEQDLDELDAGGFAPWLREVSVAIRGEGESDVPCGTCTACCASSQFVHVGPDETDALAHIPRELTFPAPGLPRGHVLLGYDEHGRCPMLGDRGCTIYAHRPRTCRTYDCRVFPATGLSPDDKPRIAARAARWRFTIGTDDERRRLDALRAAAAYLRDRGAELRDVGDEPLPANPTQLAVLAIEICELFLHGDQVVAHPPVAAVRAAVRRHLS